MNERTKKPSPLDVALSEVVRIRIAATGKRFSPTDPTLEKPKQVVEEFVAEFVVYLIARLGAGKFVKSRRAISISRGDLSFEYYFKSSSDNLAGVSIVLWPHAQVSSADLRRWRDDRLPHPGRSEFAKKWWQKNPGVLMYGMLGNFLVPHEYVSLELVDAQSRAAVRVSVTELILAIDRQIQFAISSLDNFVDYASAPVADIVCLGENACEYIAAQWGIEKVPVYVRRVVELNEGGLVRLEEYIASLRENAETNLPMNQLAGCAKFIVNNNFDSRP